MTTSTPAVSAPVRPSQTIEKSSQSELAVRMMSEAAHDIRSPLATVRESVRLVRDGELGVIGDDQKACLSAAMDQCDCVDQIVGEMVQLERLRTGIPRVLRRWVSTAEVRQSIDETLRPWAMPRDIRLLWDVDCDPNTAIFGDAAMIRRLVVNLVANSIRETAEGGSVLIRIQPARGREALQWSIVDRGRGISEVEMKEIAERQVSLGGGEGLGLSICRQLSALHFSPLRIESRAGTGTVVSFETPTGGPKSVAEAWARWRIAQRNPLRTPTLRENQLQADTNPTIRKPRQVRFDTPTVTIELGSEGTSPQIDDRLSAGTVTIGAAMPRATADAFDLLLQGHARMFDFVYRVHSRQWVWGFDASVQQTQGHIDAITQNAKQRISDIRLSWSDPQSIPLDGKRTTARLTDLLVRQSLAPSKAFYNDNNDVRLGTMPIQESDAVAERLDQEIQRMAQRLSKQTTKLQAQAKAIRPNF
ncbi:MAG: HAMP domain-containing histidine kinase [Pirellulaceae bacterium]|nr:HAMP domain-containing histidine kinase [Pirellulaceae bacterium]